MWTNEEQEPIGNKWNKAFQKDYDFWTGKEEEVKGFLEKTLGCKVETGDNDMAILDWKVTLRKKKVNIELKSRRATKDQYDDTLIWANKLAEAWKKYYSDGEETLFFFSYTDWLFFINPLNLVPRREFKLQRWGRWGIDKPKGWLYYDTSELNRIY